MTVDLVTLNQSLDVILKLLMIGAVVLVGLVLWKLDKLVKSFNRSAESLENSAQTVENVVSIARAIPFVGPKRKKKKKEVDIDE